MLLTFPALTRKCSIFKYQYLLKNIEAVRLRDLRTALIVKKFYSTTRITKKSWIDDVRPQYLQPYLHLARADKQVGTLLLFWPCSWGAALAVPFGNAPEPILLLKFFVGSIIMRSAGCIINDLLDKDFDKCVERTKNRPLASGALTVNQGILFLGLHLFGGLCVLLSFNLYTIVAGFLVVPVVLVYPLMKRYTHWPQLVLGSAFNWGAIVGWTAVHGNLSVPHVLPLYASGICWTLVYDTLYAYQDRRDDLKLGLKSTAIYFGDKPQLPLSLISGGMVAGLLLSGYVADLSLPFYAGTMLTGAALQWQIWTCDIQNPANLWLRFNANKYIGGVVLASIVGGHF